MIKTRKGFKKLEMKTIEANYQQSHKRLIIIEHEGVVPMKDVNGKLEPSSNFLRELDMVAKDPKN